MNRSLRLLVALAPAVAALLVLPLAAASEPSLPPSGTDFDYQLGGDRPVPDHVGVVVRDRESEPVADRYNVCYVNGFQTQPNEKKFWRVHWGLVLKDDGDPVVDEAWGEWLLDYRTAAKRKRLARIVGGWVEGCAAAGFAAVEYDNLDAFQRSHGLIEKADALAYAAKLVRRAHAQDLAAAQKNLAQWDGTAIDYDFALAEECAQWDECGEYVDHYGELVFDVEYRKKPFATACEDWDDTIAVVRRDLDLSEDGIRAWCPEPQARVGSAER